MDVDVVARCLPLLISPFVLHALWARQPRLFVLSTMGVASVCAASVVYEVGFLVALYRFPEIVLVNGDKLSVETLTILRRVWRVPAIASLLLSLLLGTSGYLRWLLSHRLEGSKRRQLTPAAVGAIMATAIAGLGTVVLLSTHLGHTSLLVGSDGMSEESLQLIRENASFWLAVRVAISAALGLAWFRFWFAMIRANTSDGAR